MFIVNPVLSTKHKLLLSLVVIIGFIMSLLWLLELSTLHLPQATSASALAPGSSRALLPGSSQRVRQLSKGTKLTSGIAIAPFQIRDHHNRLFDNQALTGKWHLISYGYTSCPDICPNTLLLLTQLENKLKDDERFLDLHFLFYTIDPGRDSAEKLALYVAYFSERLTGIRAGEKAKALAFEQGLGIKALVKKNGENGAYQVSHGVALYLINPNGELQAVFEPLLDPFGNRAFDIEALYRDYLWIRNNLS